MTDYRKMLDMHYGPGHVGYRAIASTFGLGKSAVGEFFSRFEKSRFSYPLEEGTTNENLFDELYSKSGRPANDKSNSYRELDYEEITRQMKSKGQTLKRLWRKYDAIGEIEGKKPYSYRQYCAKFTNWAQSQEVISHFMHSPGENTEFDYAGETLFLKNRYNPEKPVKVTIFIAVLSFSDYFYLEGLTCCDEKNWIKVCNNAVDYFGGITAIITPDNCKVAVNNCRDWIDPILNESFQDWASYHGAVILPARRKAPRWKPTVEGTVKIVTQSILIEMKDMTFFTLEELNMKLWELMDKKNAENFQNKPYSRLDLYKEEKKTLLPNYIQNRL